MKNNSTQKSIPYPPDFNPDVKKTTNFHEKFYSGIFLNDVDLFISNDKFKIKLENKDDELEEKIVTSLEDELRYPKDDLDGVLKDFIKTCASNILYFNECDYEIVFTDNNSFNFAKIPFNTLKNENGKKYQVIHDEIVDEMDLSNNKIELEYDKIISFKAPKEYNIQEIMKKLFIISNLKNRKDWVFFTDANRQNKPSIEYLRYLEKVAVANVTKDIGWNFRIEFTTEEFFLDHYYYHRFLLFQKFLTIFRESIIEEFNHALNIICKEVGFSNKIIIEGITLDVVDNIINEYEEGKIEYNKITSIFF